MACIFGEAPIGPEELFEKLTLIIPAELKRLGGESNAAWTIAVNVTLCRLAQELRFEPYCGQQSGEWLLDMVWLKGQAGMSLAAECEWIKSKEAISDDFEKILYFKAPLKLFIFQAKSHEGESAKFRQTMQGLMDQFTHHVSGEQYVLFEVGGQYAYGYKYQVPSTGKLPPVIFEELRGSPRKWNW